MTRKMKDSGVEWIGEIPKDWKVTTISRLFNIKAGGDLKKEYYSKVKINEYIYPIYTNSTDTKQVYGYTKVPFFSSNTITVTGRGDIGFAVYRNCEYDAIIRLLVLSPINKKDCRYYAYFINGVIRFNENSSAIGQLSTQQIAPYKICVPDLSEQKRISDYLDNKCNKIDQTIEKEQVVIEKLKEYKQSVITEAVTKGLNPDVKMKDSGVEWIGEIPKHCLCKKFKGITNQIIDGTHSTPNYQEDGIPFLRVTDITTDDGVNQDINWDKTAYINEREHNELIKRCNPQKGDLLVSKNGTIGVPKIVDWNREFSIFVSLCLIKVKEEISVEFLYYYFKSSLIWTEIAIGGKTGTITNLHLDKIREFKIPLPNKDEQQQIVNYLDKKCSAIDKLISNKEKVIDKLTEYKKSLIYECVTGKREVQ